MKTRALILALSFGLTSLPAFAAQPATDAASIEVRTGDLDLSAPRDQQRLEARITRAARTLCTTGRRGVAEAALRSQCIAAALAEAKPQAARAITRADGGSQLALLMVRAPR